MTCKKKCRASTRAYDPFSDNLKIWPTFIYRGEVPSNTFAKLPVHALINDPQEMFWKKLYVTIPQWFETFPNMSNLWPGRNRAKCGLQLNDPIDWLKLRLSQPKIRPLLWIAKISDPPWTLSSLSNRWQCRLSLIFCNFIEGLIFLHSTNLPIPTNWTSNSRSPVSVYTDPGLMKRETQLPEFLAQLNIVHMNKRKSQNDKYYFTLSFINVCK